MAKGASKGNGRGGGGKAVTTEKTDAQMMAEMEAEFAEINKMLDDFLYHNPKNIFLDDMNPELPHIEKSSIKEIKSNYIDEFNSTLRNTGDGFTYWGDDVVSILYNDGHVNRIEPQWWDGDKRIPTTGIRGIIVEGEWGTAIAGKSIKLENYRETVKVGDKYGYRSVKAKYNDFNDIRADFE